LSNRRPVLTWQLVGAGFDNSFFMRNDIVIIALKYEEPEYQETIKCIEATGLPVIWANRDGVGNYSRAFNEAFKHGVVWMPNALDAFMIPIDFKYTWMISNITFAPDIPFKLAEVLDKMTNVSAVHPAMPGSDHRHQWPNIDPCPTIVPFIEWTAPMVRTDAFRSVKLNEELAYYYMDLDWCYRISRVHKLGNVAVAHHAVIGHTYLRSARQHLVSKIRSQLRDWWTPRSQREMARIYGPGWKKDNWVETFNNLKIVNENGSDSN
jgi:hypothetical protein